MRRLFAAGLVGLSSWAVAADKPAAAVKPALVRRPTPAVYAELGLPLPPDPLPPKYLPDAVTVDQVRANPEKFPLRAAALDALTALKAARAIKPMSQAVRVRGGVDQKPLRDVQEKLARSIVELDEAAAALEKAATADPPEAHPRWQAHAALLAAECRLRWVMLSQYNYVLGQLRTDTLPELTGEQNGWQLVPAVALLRKSEHAVPFRLASDGFQAVREQHPDTPWAEAAERLGKLSPSLRWEPAVLDKAD